MNRIHHVVAVSQEGGVRQVKEFQILVTDVEGEVDVITEQNLVLNQLPKYFRVERVRTDELMEPKAFLLGIKEAL